MNKMIFILVMTLLPIHLFAAITVDGVDLTQQSFVDSSNIGPIPAQYGLSGYALCGLRKTDRHLVCHAMEHWTGSWVEMSEGRAVSQYVIADSGGDQFCYIDTSMNLFCMGGNQFGQLGFGYASDQESKAGQVLANVTSFATGAGDLSCAISNGSAMCWGCYAPGYVAYGDHHDRSCGTYSPMGPDHGPFSEIGIDSRGRPIAPRPLVFASGFSSGAQIVIGGFGQPCIFDGSKSVKCYDLGYRFTQSEMKQSEEFNVSGQPIRLIRSSENVSAHDSPVCLLYDSNEVRCWGPRMAGQLGTDAGIFDGTRKPLPDAPMKFKLLKNKIQDLVLVEDSVCSITDKKEVFCTGEIKRSQIGKQDLPAEKIKYVLGSFIPRLYANPYVLECIKGRLAEVDLTNGNMSDLEASCAVLE